MFISNVYGYLDPASLSFFMQALIGVFIAAAVALKLFWARIKLKFSNRKFD
jgi:hypothetical protein